jgi:hypothetical protein
LRKEHELKADIERAQQADSIINHPLFIAALKELRDSTNEIFKSLSFENTVEMQECNVKLNLIDEFEGNLVGLIRNGNAAFESLNTLKQHDKDMMR